MLCFNAEKQVAYVLYRPPRHGRRRAGGDLGSRDQHRHGGVVRRRRDLDLSRHGRHRYGKDAHPKDYTYWAPEVIWFDGTYHMYLSYVPGIFTDWNHPREIVHLTSKDGVKWATVAKLDLQVRTSHRRLRDPAPERHMAHVVQGRNISPAACLTPTVRTCTTGNPRAPRLRTLAAKGPKVIHWKGNYWLIADCWQNGMRVWSSDDCLNWKPQEEALFGSHGDVVVSGGRAWWFYFGGPRPAGIGVRSPRAHHRDQRARAFGD